MAPTARARARGALLGTFVGDALGMPWEGHPSKAIPEDVEMAEARLGRGTYTDDTEMMINLAESLLEHGAVDDDHLARAFLKGHDPYRGYGRGTLEVFSLWETGTPVAHAASQVFDGTGSRGNGAAMRIAPVAVKFAGSPDLLEQARRSAEVTHRHPVAVDGAVVAAVAVAAALRGEPVLDSAAAAAVTPELIERLGRVEQALDEQPQPEEIAERLGNAAVADESVPAAIYSAVAHDNFESAVRFAVRCGGDTDTIAAVAGAIAGAAHGIEAIPERWVEALEDGARGRSYVLTLADRLLS